MRTGRGMMAAVLLAMAPGWSAVFAQAGPCLLGVGNCPPGSPSNVDPGNHTVYIQDSRAGEIWRARQANQDYLLVLQRYTENGNLCEERAWVGGELVGGPGGLSVKVGPARKVCYDPARPIWNAQQVNQVMAAIDSWRNQIGQWENYSSWYVQYVNAYRAYPTAVAYGQGEINRARAWVSYLQNQITSYQNVVSQLAP